MIDLHCHILPGLDDGAKSLDLALEMARLAVGEENARELRGGLVSHGVPVEIRPGAEVHITHNLLDEVRRHKSRLVLNGSGYMFVEFPSDHIYRGARELFFELMNEGVTPIIAHPERNSVFGHNPGLLYDLVSQGALVQANAGSFTGRYGRRVSESACRLLEWRLVHFIASDGHNADTLPPRLAEAARKAAALAGDGAARALVEDNPLAVLENRELPYLPAPADPRKARKSITIGLPWRRKGK